MVALRATTSLALALTLMPAQGARAETLITARARADDGAWLPYAPSPSARAGLCLVDTGVDLNPDTEPTVVDRIAIDNGTPNDVSPDTHGTVMAMMAGAPRNSWGMVGTAPGAVQIVSVRILEPGQTTFPFSAYASGITACLRIRAQYNIRVINLSLGSPSTPSSQDVTAITNAVREANDYGLAVVAAAGNDDGGPVEYPAAAPGVLSVGATDTTTGAFCSFSNHGEGLRLTAPGCDLNGATLGGAPTTQPSAMAPSGTVLYTAPASPTGVLPLPRARLTRDGTRLLLTFTGRPSGARTQAGAMGSYPRSHRPRLLRSITSAQTTLTIPSTGVLAILVRYIDPYDIKRDSPWITLHPHQKQTPKPAPMRTNHRRALLLTSLLTTLAIPAAPTVPAAAAAAVPSLHVQLRAGRSQQLVDLLHNRSFPTLTLRAARQLPRSPRRNRRHTRPRRRTINHRRTGTHQRCPIRHQRRLDLHRTTQHNHHGDHIRTLHRPRNRPLQRLVPRPPRRRDHIIPGETCLDTVQNDDTCFIGGPPGQGGERSIITGLSAHELTLGIDCQAPQGQECVTGAILHKVWAAMYGATATLADPTPPTLSQPTGTLWEPGTANGYHHGNENVTVNAHDAGGGVQSIVLAADGQPIETYSAPCDFTHNQPCPLATGAQTLTLPRPNSQTERTR